MSTRRKVSPTLSRIRSAVTNGKFLVDGTDHRSAWMRRLRDLVAAHVSDMSGDDQISHSERVLINRASMLTLQLEMLEQKFAEQDGVATPDQLQNYQRVTNTLRRTLKSLDCNDARKKCRRSSNTCRNVPRKWRMRRQSNDRTRTIASA